MKLIYLASPYSHADPAVMDQRFEAVCEAAANYMRAGTAVFSPIAHTHPIAVRGDLPKHFDFWRGYDERMIDACDELWVLMLDGWMESQGVTAEIEIAREYGKPVYHVTAREES